MIGNPDAKGLVRPGMKQVDLVVYEQRGSWAHAWQQAAALAVSGGLLQIEQARSVSECLAALDRSPAALVSLELRPDNAQRVLGALVRLGEEFPRAAAVVTADRQWRIDPLEVRELGAIDLVTSPRGLGRLARWALERRAELAEAAGGTREAIWRRLPWGAAE